MLKYFAAAHAPGSITNTATTRVKCLRHAWALLSILTTTAQNPTAQTNCTPLSEIHPDELL